MLNGTTHVTITTLRSMIAAFDESIYFLLYNVFRLFFNITRLNLVDGKIVFDIFSRVQLIIGIFMLFQLTMTVIKGIVNPNSFMDSKSGGAGNIIMRIIIALILLSLLVPLNIPSPKNEYEKQINNNGVLFGTLYSLQYRVLNKDVFGRLILGENAGDYTGNQPDNMKLDEFADSFVGRILKIFYQPSKNEQGEYLCSDIVEQYENGPSILAPIGYYKASCNNQYAIDMVPFISTIAGSILVVLLFMMTFNVAKRVFQLAALQLVAPIPIISYMDPKGSKDGAFNSWLKLLMSTYLELFIQLAVIYFSFSVIGSFIRNFEISSNGSGSTMVWNWTLIIMSIALFVFAKDAPKFFKQMLGIKDNGKGFFGAFGAAMAIGNTAMGLGTAAVGSVGSAVTGYKTASEENSALHPKQERLNVLRNFGSAITSGIAGGYTGMRAALKDKSTPSSVLKAVGDYNAGRAAHKTFIGGFTSDASMLTTGRSLARKDQLVLDASKEAASSLKNYKSIAVDEAMKKGDYGFVTADMDRTGQLANRGFNLRVLEAAMQAKDANGFFDVEYVELNDPTNKKTARFNVSWFDANTMSSIEDTQTARYLRDNFEKGEFKNGKIDSAWRQADHAMHEAKIGYSGEYLGDIGEIKTDEDTNYSAYGDIGKKIGQANANVTDMSTNMKNIKHRANERK